MTVVGQFVGFAGRSVGSVADGSGADTDPWRFAFQSLDGSTGFGEVRDSSGYYFEYIPDLTPPTGFHQAGDLVAFTPVEAVFQGFAGTFPKGIKTKTMQVFGWVNYTLHWAGETYPDTTKYVVLVDPDHAGCYILAHYLEIQNLTP